MLTGGGGIDTASYATATAGVTVRWRLPRRRPPAGRAATRSSSIENLVGSAFSDTLTASGTAAAGVVNLLSGGAGNDTLNATVDNVRDTLDGGAGTDTANYAAYAAALTVNLGGAAPIVVGGSGNNAANSDVLVGIENFTGGGGNDTITGSAGANVLNGGGGNDTFNYTIGGGADTIDGGAGNDTLNITGVANNDVLDVVLQRRHHGLRRRHRHRRRVDHRQPRRQCRHAVVRDLRDGRHGQPGDGCSVGLHLHRQHPERDRRLRATTT